jgi:hypothetical protein
MADVADAVPSAGRMSYGLSVTRRRTAETKKAIVEAIGLLSSGARELKLVPGGERLTDGQLTVAIAMAMDRAIVEWWGSAAQERLALVVAVAARALILDERVYVVAPTDAGAVATAAVANALVQRYDGACGLLGEELNSQTLAAMAERYQVVVGSRGAFDAARMTSGYRPPDGWVFESVDVTAAGAAELIGDAWWTGSTEAIGGKQGRAEFARLGKSVVQVRPDRPRIAEDYDVEVADFEAAVDYAVRQVEEAQGFPVLVEVDTALQAEAVAARLPGAVVLVEEYAERAFEVLAQAGRRGAVTVTNIRRREHDIELEAGLDVVGGGLGVISLGTPSSFRAELHTRLRAGRLGEHGRTWTVRYPTD